MEKLHAYIKEKCSPMTGTYRINGVGKLLEDFTHKISDLEMEDGDYLIV